MQSTTEIRTGEERLQTLPLPTQRTGGLSRDVERISVKRLHLDSLDELVEAVPMLLAQLGQRAADLWRDSYNAKQDILQAEAKAYRAISGQSAKGKPPTVSFVERSLVLNTEVQKAHLKYAQIEAERRKVEAMINALQAQRSFIPGLQGRDNYIRQNERK